TGTSTGTSAGTSSGTSAGTTGGTPPPSAGCSATYRTVNAWTGGYQSEVTVKNTGSSAISGWTASWSQPAGDTITSLWNAVQGSSGGLTTAKNAPYNGTLGAGASTTFGYTVNGGAAPTLTLSCQAS
ncbi:cellulose binding domain-containing protein, partial [Actinacidiphila paucisporea]